MNKKAKWSVVFIVIFTLLYTDEKEKNNSRINQIDSQVNKNKQQINKNSQEISKAKKDENVNLGQLKKIEADIKKLENEYNDAQKRYTEVMKEIGKNDEEIRKDIEKINENSEVININKEDLGRKIIIWNKISRRKETAIVFSDVSVIERRKRSHDLKKFLEKQKVHIQETEKAKAEVESSKKEVEGIKAKNESQASRIASARSDLEKKNRELNAAKQEKNRIVAALRGKQNTLTSENNKIEKSNKELISERRKLEAAIQAIIAKELREIELQKQRAEEARKKAEMERLRAEEAAKNSGSDNERSTSALSGEKSTGNTGKPTTTTTTTTTKTTTPTYTPPSGTGSLIMPMSGKVVVQYGQEKVAGLTSKGIEIRGSVGQEVKAADSGNVIYSGSLNNLGNVVIIDHGNLITVYGNLSGVNVSKGQKVSKGQRIGTLGRDINREANLYFETRKGVNVVNPMSYL